MTEEDKGAYKYCKNCGRVLSPTYEAELCPTCEENQLFDKVRDYIRKNDVTEMQVAEHFGIPQKKVKAWWWEANGKVQLAIRYGNKVLPLGKNTNAVELESTAEIVPTPTTIKQAAEAGELDSAIESVTASIVRKPK